MIRLTIDQYDALREEYAGYCLHCGEQAYGVEPDACSYECDLCGSHAVYGIEELMMLGHLQIVFEQEMEGTEV